MFRFLRVAELSCCVCDLGWLRALVYIVVIAWALDYPGLLRMLWACYVIYIGYSSYVGFYYYLMLNNYWQFILF